MHLKTLFGPLALLSCVSAYPSDPFPDGSSAPSRLDARNSVFSYCPSKPASEAYQRRIFNSFVTALYITKNVTLAFDKFIDLNLIEHDPFDPQGRDANAAKLSAIIPFVDFQILRQSFDNNIGFIHLRINVPGGEPIALADIYRMSGTCIVEHWDVTQARPANATNPIAMF